MKTQLLLLAAAGLTFAACNNKTTADMPVATIDTTSHTTADTNAVTNVSSGDAEKAKMEDSIFLAKASATGVFEIEAAKLAEKNSQSADVKGFATMMKAEHTSMGKEVEGLAKTEGITLPVGMGDDNKKEWDKLNDLKGAKFDKEYASVNVKGHKDAIDLFEKAINNKDNSDGVHQLANKGLPTLKTHKEHADQLKDKLK